MVAALTGALISGVAMYAVGARAQANQVPETPALVETVGSGQFVPVASSYRTAAPAAVRTAAPRSAVYRAPAPRTTVYSEPAQESVYDDRPERTWGKTAMIIGGSAASGAGVGGIVGGKKGALIGAAIGGGAASIYEATKRR
jgi:hypothetical protein